MAFGADDSRKKLDGKEVDGIMKQVAAGQSLTDALRVVAGVGDLFTNGLGVPLIIPPALLVPLTRRAWKCQQQNADAVYDLVRKGLADNPEEMGEDLIAIGEKLKSKP